MRLVKCIFRKAHHAVKDFIRRRLVDPPGSASGHVFLRVSHDKVPAFLCHDIRLLLGHGTAHQIAAPVGIASQVADDLHHLLLVDDTAIGSLQDRLEKGRIIMHRGCLLLPPDIGRDKAHRPRPVQGDPGDHILKASGLELLHKALHPGRLQLEDPFTFPCGNILEYPGIIRINPVNVQVSIFILRAYLPDRAPMPAALRAFFLALRDHPCRFLDHRQVAQAQKVHLQKPEVLYRILGKLRYDVALGGERKGDEIIDPPLADHDACCMSSHIPGKPFQLFRHVDKRMDPGVIFIHVPKLLADLKRDINGHSGG